MGLQSSLFRGDAKLEACLSHGSAPVFPGVVGEHIRKIQTALAALDHALINPFELAAKRYGPSTAAALRAFQKKRGIPNQALKAQTDDHLEKMTIAVLDSEMAKYPVQKELAEQDKPLAQSLVQEALKSLDVIEQDFVMLQSGGSLSLPRQGWDALQTHFHLNFSAIPETARVATRKDLSLVRQNYQKVERVFSKSALSFQNGKTPPGVPASGNFDQQRIYFGPLYKDFDSSDGEAIGPNSRAAILISESIHLAEDYKPEAQISEFDPLYDTLSAEQALHNPSSYAAFAWHVARGFDKPRFGLGPTRKR